MIRVPVHRLETGQVLAQDVTREDGVILMSKGVTITEAAISMLQRLDVDAVVVEGERFASPEEKDAYLREQERALEERFSRVCGDKVLLAVRELFRLNFREGLMPPPKGDS